MKANTTNPMLKSEGKLFVNGEECIQAKKVLIKATINTAKSKPLGCKTQKTRTTGYDISVEVGMYKTTKFGADIIKKYIDKGITPEFTIQALNSDKDSDFFNQYGNDTVTVTGCVPTGDINLLDLDGSSSDFCEDTITFDGGQLT